LVILKELDTESIFNFVDTFVYVVLLGLTAVLKDVLENIHENVRIEAFYLTVLLSPSIFHTIMFSTIYYNNPRLRMFLKRELSEYVAERFPQNWYEINL